jgi:signal transduction histidine kinase
LNYFIRLVKDFYGGSNMKINTMNLRGIFRGYTIYWIVLLITLLLIGNIYLIYRNSETIKHNVAIYEEAEKIKVNTTDVVRHLHLIDMMLRSYALMKNPDFMETADSCIRTKDIIYTRLENSLSRQEYDMKKFTAMRDGTYAYYAIINKMREHLIRGEDAKFLEILKPDPGYDAWTAYRLFVSDVNDFENNIKQQAYTEYLGAVRNSYLFQIVLFFLTIPTLAFTAYHATRDFYLSEKLRKSHEENYKIVAEQNEMLERMVKQRTTEVVAQNKMISAQNEEITARNEQLELHQREIEVRRNELSEQYAALQEANKIIEQQRHEIQFKHDELEKEVERQTHDLKQTNLELIEYNRSLEQFAYIISHNLRGPMARLTGLASILALAQDEAEVKSIIGMMVKSTYDLDQVIKDLTAILEVQKTGSQMLSEIKLEALVDKAVTILSSEIQETGTVLKRALIEKTVYSLAPYLESIIYNLLSNSIKYRHPDRRPEISIRSVRENGYTRIEVEDNGLGMDLKTYKNNLFNLYKRFHFHVEGKGLGLYLVKTQIMALGGRIEVKSEPDQGTTFLLFLKNA